MAESYGSLGEIEEKGLGSSLSSLLARLDQDYKAKSTKQHGTPFDSDAFDSMAVMNSEMWNEGGSDQVALSRDDILSVDPRSLSREQLEDTFLKSAQTGVLELVKELHELCGDDILSIRDEDEYTPLHRASYNGHVDVMEYLLHSGADIEARTIDGWQPIHCACRWNQVRAASLLLQNGALVNSKTNGAQTPLHLAASNDRAKATLELLLRHKDLDPSLLNGQSETAFQLAERNGRFSYLFLMVDKSVDHRKFLENS